MLTLGQSMKVRGDAGVPLPTVFKSLEAQGINFQRGQLVLVCAGPGTGKSALALTLTLRSGVPAFYFSADSDAFTQIKRSVSILTGMTLAHAGDLILRGETGLSESIMSSLPVRFSYDPSPSVDDIERSLKSYREVYGEWPELVIIDNVTDLTYPGEDDRLDGLMGFLHTLARRTGACVIALHHVIAKYNNADEPIPLNGIKDQIGKTPSMILTVYRISGGGYYPDTLCVSPVKNRNGKSDPSAQTRAELEFIGESLTIKDA